MVGGEGSQYFFEGDSTEIPYKMAFLKKKTKKQNKNKLNEDLSSKLLKPHQGDQIMTETYRNTPLRSQSSYSELDIQVLFRPCETEEADQCLVRYIELD